MQGEKDPREQAPRMFAMVGVRSREANSYASKRLTSKFIWLPREPKWNRTVELGEKYTMKLELGVKIVLAIWQSIEVTLGEELRH